MTQSSNQDIIVKKIDQLALSKGPVSQESVDPEFLDVLTTKILIRSRRFRVLDWMCTSGFHLLNILPDVEEFFLKFSENFDLNDKYAVPAQFWPFYKTNIKSNPLFDWLDKVAQFETLLVEIRKYSDHSSDKALFQPNENGKNRVILASGIKILRIEFGVLSLHELLPNYSVSLTKKSQISNQFRMACETADRTLAPLLFVPPLNDLAASVYSITDQQYQILSRLNHSHYSIDLARSEMGTTDFDEMCSMNLFEFGEMPYE